MSKIIRANGSIEDVSPKNGKDWQLDELQAIVGGYIEMIPLKDGEIMILNEEGKLDQLPVNGLATLALVTAHPGTDDFIVGDVLICPSNEVE